MHPTSVAIENAENLHFMAVTELSPWTTQPLEHLYSILDYGTDVTNWAVLRFNNDAINTVDDIYLSLKWTK